MEERVEWVQCCGGAGIVFSKSFLPSSCEVEEIIQGCLLKESHLKLDTLIIVLYLVLFIKNIRLNTGLLHGKVFIAAFKYFWNTHRPSKSDIGCIQQWLD